MRKMNKDNLNCPFEDSQLFQKQKFDFSNMNNYEKHAHEFLIVIAAVAVSCKHGLCLGARVNTNAGNKDTMYFISCIFFVYLSDPK